MALISLQVISKSYLTELSENEQEDAAVVEAVSPAHYEVAIVIGLGERSLDDETLL